MKIAVYCSSSNRIPQAYLRLGDFIGGWIAANGHSLVCGGATGGLMSRVSESFRRVLPRPFGEQRLIGIVPELIVKSGRKADYCDELQVVSNMNERKQMMRETADCFVCLPGSYGTLDEMFDVIAAGTIREHSKPMYILNYKNFYTCLKQEIEHMRSLSFIPQEENYAPCFVDTMDELTAALNNFK